MSGILDVDFNAQRAEDWKREVDNELDAVDRLLLEVAQVSSTVPGENDTIFNGIYEVCQKLDQSWREMSKTFKDVASKLDEAISSYKNLILQKKQEIEELKSKTHN